MRTPVLIRIGDQEGGSTPEVSGIYMEKDGTHYLFYETQSDGQCRIRISGNDAEIIRRKNPASEIKICLHEFRPLQVVIPAGTLEMGTFGTDIRMILTEDQKLFELSYDLTDGEKRMAHQTVSIRVKKS